MKRMIWIVAIFCISNVLAEEDNGVSLLQEIASSQTVNKSREALFNVWKQGEYKMDAETKAFYEEVTGLSEFTEKGGEKFFQRKWNGVIPFAIWSVGNNIVDLKKEIARLLPELNIYMETAQFVPAKSAEDVKFWIILGDEEVFLKLRPVAEPYLADNYGLFWCNWDKNSVMTSCTTYVDTERAEDPALQKHLLREEITQALGLMNDSPQFSDSMFYSRFSLTSQFSYRDVWSIYELYRSD